MSSKRQVPQKSLSPLETFSSLGFHDTSFSCFCCCFFQQQWLLLRSLNTSVLRLRLGPPLHLHHCLKQVHPVPWLLKINYITFFHLHVQWDLFPELYSHVSTPFRWPFGNPNTAYNKLLIPLPRQSPVPPRVFSSSLYSLAIQSDAQAPNKLAIPITLFPSPLHLECYLQNIFPICPSNLPNHCTLFPKSLMTFIFAFLQCNLHKKIGITFFKMINQLM